MKNTAILLISIGNIFLHTPALLAARFNITHKVQVESLVHAMCTKLNISPIDVKLNPHSKHIMHVEMALLNGKPIGRPSISINPDIAQTVAPTIRMQRFAIGHEIAHIAQNHILLRYIHMQRAQDHCWWTMHKRTGNLYKEQEMEADTISAIALDNLSGGIAFFRNYLHIIHSKQEHIKEKSPFHPTPQERLNNLLQSKKSL